MKADHRKTDRKTKWELTAIVVLLCLICTLIICVFLNHRSIVITPNGDADVYVEYGDSYVEEGVKASVRNSTLFFLHKDLDVSVQSNVNDKKLGKYTVVYTASYDDDTKTYTRNVTVQDSAAPEIKLVSDSDSYTPYNHAYTEEGYTASDVHDGDLTAQVKAEEKDGKVYYSVTDSSGNTGTAERTIKYDDRLGPEITLDGGDSVVCYVGDSYSDSYSAVDDVDGDVTANVAVSGSIDSGTPGIYTLSYTVTDAHGNTSTAQRTVTVKVRPVNVVTADENSRTIYLTFDDGPGPYTEELLDVLDKYNVKATFFTTSAHPEYAYVIGEEASRGHTVAVHTYTHKYSQIYASTDAYWSDFNAQNAVVAAQTGSYTNLFRFPGGSSNTVSKNYCAGIMSALTEQSSSLGYVYFDWNVSSGDAGGTTSTSDVYQNVVDQVTGNTKWGIPSIVLQHDVKHFSVKAVESIIIWGLENGYSFHALSPGSYHAHQRIAN